MIVEDHSDNQQLLLAILNRAGYRDIVLADTAKKAMEILAGQRGAVVEEAVDLILLDVLLPDMDGIQLCYRLKENSRLADIPVIMVTGVTELSYLQAAFEAGAVDYITKPYRKEELLARLRAAMLLKKERDRRRARERELEELTQALKLANHRLQIMVHQDGLTGIANRRYLEEYLTVLEREQNTGEPFSLIMLDIDYFKLYNDTCGHLAGDACLKQLAQNLARLLPGPRDLLARYGGEEFVAVLPGMPPARAEQLAGQMRELVRELAIPHRQNPRGGIVTISQGVAGMEQRGAHSLKVLLEAADAALYRAKNAGRNRVCTTIIA
ncbi:MAG: GGDEF domain-containing response regulator [Desulfurispora sp.]|uniref:GGDEF domain-containing response regulator n=1 Tax=Desulfurispora sp. TaxID=3014275 RepID=UPI00404A3BA4